MAESFVRQVVETITEALKFNATQNATANAEPAKPKIPSTPEGIAIAYGSIVVMAVLPVLYGSFRSVKHQKKQKVWVVCDESCDCTECAANIRQSEMSQRVVGDGGERVFGMRQVDVIVSRTASGEVPDIMTSSDAMRFPIIASIALFSFYTAFKIFSKDSINLVLTGYFLMLGVLALTHILSPLADWLVPSRVPKIPYHLLFTQGAAQRKEALIDFRFNTYDIICLVASAAIGVWYLLQKHWIANNLFGLAFSVNGIEMLHLNNVVTGCILLSGLFLYDIFWVFGTDVMVTVARNFEAPIKLVFPQDILTNGWSASNFAMLGLGDIVIPGIFIALLLRFDISLGRKGKLYFWATYGAYVAGLLLTLVILHTFKHAQPVLLYLVPLCLGTPILVALAKGDLKKLFAYEDFSEQQKAGKKSIDKKAEKADKPVTETAPSKTSKKEKKAKKSE